MIIVGILIKDFFTFFKKQQIHFLFVMRYDRFSTIFVSQYKTADWHTRLGGSLHADAIMDRIVHNSITIESSNVNMRERIHKK